MGFFVFGLGFLFDFFKCTGTDRIKIIQNLLRRVRK